MKLKKVKVTSTVLLFLAAIKACV